MKVTFVIALFLLSLLSFFSLPALAANGSVTINMTTESVVAISLSQTNWALGEVSTNTEEVTSPSATWCTITNEGNANVNIYIQGEDAQWVGHPLNSYKWLLSNNNTSDPGNPDAHRYVLWYHIANDNAGSYTLVTKESLPMRHVKEGSAKDGTILTLSGHGDQAQFGLKLLTPTYFYGGRQMQARIIVSAVAA